MRFEVELSAVERIVLLNGIPREGSRAAMKATREFLEELGWSDEEYAALRKRETEEREKSEAEGRSPTGVQPDWLPLKTVSCGPQMAVVIIDWLKKLDNDKRLPITHLSLWEKFVERDGNKAADEKVVGSIRTEA